MAGAVGLRGEGVGFRHVGLFVLRGGAWVGGLFPHCRKSHPVYSPPRLLSCCCIVHGLYNLLVCVCVCLRASGFVVSWDHGIVPCVPGVGVVGMVGRGEKGKNSGGGCDNERKSSTPHMSDLNRAALGYPTTEILVA